MVTQQYDLNSMLMTILSPPWIFIIIAVIGLFIFYQFFYKKKPEETFQIEDFRESVYTATSELIKKFGVKIDAVLIRGIEPVGKINKYYHFIGMLRHKENPDKKDSKFKAVPADLWIFRIGNPSKIMYYLSMLFGDKFNYDYVVLENKEMHPFNGNNKRWAMLENVSLQPFGSVYIASKVAEIYIADISFRRSTEEILTHAQNFPRKVAYLELRQAKVIERLEASAEKKSASFDAYRKNVMGAGKDLEDITDGDGDDT